MYVPLHVQLSAYNGRKNVFFVPVYTRDIIIWSQLVVSCWNIFRKEISNKHYMKGTF